MCDAGTDTVQHANTDVEVLLVGNKTDMADKRTVSSAQALQARFPSPLLPSHIPSHLPSSWSGPGPRSGPLRAALLPLRAFERALDAHATFLHNSSLETNRNRQQRPHAATSMH